MSVAPGPPRIPPDKPPVHPPGTQFTIAYKTPTPPPSTPSPPPSRIQTIQERRQATRTALGSREWWTTDPVTGYNVLALGKGVPAGQVYAWTPLDIYNIVSTGLLVYGAAKSIQQIGERAALQQSLATNEAMRRSLYGQGEETQIPIAWRQALTKADEEFMLQTVQDVPTEPFKRAAEIQILPSKPTGWAIQTPYYLVKGEGVPTLGGLASEEPILSTSIPVGGAGESISIMNVPKPLPTFELPSTFIPGVAARVVSGIGQPQKPRSLERNIVDLFIGGMQAPSIHPMTIQTGLTRQTQSLTTEQIQRAVPQQVSQALEMPTPPRTIQSMQYPPADLFPRRQRRRHPLRIPSFIAQYGRINPLAMPKDVLKGFWK
jgi:hypothetical protein